MKVFYNENQATTAYTDFSPSARKPKDLVEHWLDLDKPITVVDNFDPVSAAQFYAAHEEEHVNDVLSCKKFNGFRTRSVEIAKTLPWTSGSLLAAAKYARENNTIAMSPTSGFHHATHNACMGFCTFNGLMVTAIELLNSGSSKIGILDLDHHYGNGTDTILEWLVTDKGTLRGNQVHHYTVGGDPNFNIEDGKWGGRPSYSWAGFSEQWLAALPSIVSAFNGCDVVLLQAGADPHVDDPCHKMLNTIGALTTEQFAVRDKIVFETLAELEIPTAWNLAGGYQTPLQKVLDIHTQTLDECLKVL